MKTDNNSANIEQFLDALKDPKKALTEWEEGFIESIEYQYSRKRYLSDKQFEILERIYAQKTD